MNHTLHNSYQSDGDESPRFTTEHLIDTARVTSTTYSPTVVLRHANMAGLRHLRSVQKTMDKMINLTGGECGRDFDAEEQRTFLVLLKVRDLLLALKGTE